MLRRRFSLFVPSLALLAALLVVSPALSALRGGTNGPDTLTGTSRADQLTGKGDEDILKGLAGNDTYYFAENFSRRADGSVGFDTLVELSGQGSDTVSFKGVKTGQVFINLQPQWTHASRGDWNRALGPGGEVRFSYTNAGTLVQSSVEKAIGGQGNFDYISGGSGPNTIQPGGGATDDLTDYGGYNVPGSNFPPLPASNDVFKGFADNTGTDFVSDWGGTGDVLDLRPFSTEDVYIEPFDYTSLTAGDESLQIVTGPTSQVIVVGQFSPVYSNHQGRIEKIIFADATITDTKTLSVAAAGTEELTGRQAELAEVAPRLAQEARALIDASDRTGIKRPPGAGGSGAEVGPGKEPGTGAKDKAKKDKRSKDKSVKHDKKSKHDKQAKDKKAKKQGTQGKRQGLQRGTARRG